LSTIRANGRNPSSTRPTRASATTPSTIGMRSRPSNGGSAPPASRIHEARPITVRHLAVVQHHLEAYGAGHVPARVKAGEHRLPPHEEAVDDRPLRDRVLIAAIRSADTFARNDLRDAHWPSS